MGDGDGTAGRYLAFEHGNDAAAAAEHVPEADGHEHLPVVRVPGGYSQEEFDHAFRGAHHGSRVHGLVCRDVHEVRHPVLPRQVHEVAAADHVVEDRFFRVQLHERHVLVRRGMEHDVGPQPPEDVVEPGTVLDGADHAVVGDVGPVAVEFPLERIDGVFTVPEQHEAFRVEPADLPDEFTADGAAGAGDHHPVTC